MPPEYFVLNDESQKNSHGFRLLNSGGDFSRFNTNPVMLHNHDYGNVIGRWAELRVEGQELRAKPVFDTDDPDALKISGKVERGFLKAASVGMYIKDAKYIELPTGEMDLVVTSWELLEGSVVGVPSNSGSIAFYSAEGTKLSVDDALKTVQQLAAPTHPLPTPPHTLMNKITLTAEAATCLGIPAEHDTGTAISAAVMALEAKRANAETALNALKKERAEALVDLAIAQGKIDATRKESFVNLAITDYKNASDILAAMPAKQELGAGIKPPAPGAAGIPGDRAGWDFLKWSKEDPEGLTQLRAKDPTAYETLRAGYKSKLAVTEA